MCTFNDLTGKKIGRLTFEKHYKEGKKNYWQVFCDCGNRQTYRADYISTMKCLGRKFECSKCKQKRRCPILPDQKYGRLTVIRQIPSKDDRHTFFLCLCDCGVYTELPGTRLTCKIKPSRSCGCYARKLHSKWANTTQYPPIHGCANTKNRRNKTTLHNLYTVRQHLIASCYNKKNTRYFNYGAKGYTVCDLWRNGAKDFVDWAFENGYRKGMALDIKNGQTIFNPENCYWIPKRKLMSINRSIFIEHDGFKLSLSEWAKKLGCSIACISMRLRKYKDKYGIEKVLDLSWNPPKIKVPKFQESHSDIIQMYHQGYTFLEISQKIGCTPSYICHLFKKQNIQARPAKTRSSLNK